MSQGEPKKKEEKQPNNDLGPIPRKSFHRNENFLNLQIAGTQ